MTSPIEILLRMIDQAFDHKSWHGTNLRGSIRGLSPSEVKWRPQPRRHNIWEIVVHAAYWKYTVRRRLLGEKRGSFPLNGSDWFERPVPETGDEMALWKADLKLLADMHRGLRNAVAQLKPKDLARVPAGGTLPTLALVTGIAAHDFYHAGQIQLLKRLQAD